MNIETFRNEYAELVCPYENLNTIGDDFKQSSLKKRYNALLDSVARRMKYMQCSFLRHFPKSEEDFKKNVRLLKEHNNFSSVLRLMREFPELCQGVEAHLLSFISYLWRNDNALFVQNSADILTCFTIQSVCRFVFVHLNEFPEMSLIMGDLFHIEQVEDIKTEVCLLMCAVCVDAKQPSSRQKDFLKLFV